MRPQLTACTIGLGSIADIRRRAKGLSSVPLIKIKVDGTRHVDWISVVREEAPQARLVIDANQSWTRELIESLMPELLTLGIEFIEQPVRRGQDDTLDGLRSPIPIVADESCTDRNSLQALVNRYQGINIKLDKCGGLTEALALARNAQALGLDVMVGNMCGTSLGMAPAFLVAQLAHWVDLDGPLLQREDRPDAMRYVNGTVDPPAASLWG
jgi:L-alanine-DL-glutamate epimerase-like enolase superfamily enzyme